jgi:hypothetical protein
MTGVTERDPHCVRFLYYLAPRARQASTPPDARVETAIC